MPPRPTNPAGIDLNPLNLNDEGDVAWLDALIWPEHADRRARLRSAVEVARVDLAPIVPAVTERLRAESAASTDFVLALDAEPLGFTQPHGRALHWLGEQGALPR